MSLKGYPMTDREMLLLSYGAMIAVEPEEPKLALVVELVEKHLFPVEKPEWVEKGDEFEKA